MAFHPSRRKLRPREEEETGELNIVPYLDIMLNLIMFMLLSMTGLVSYGILNVAAPKYAPPSASASQDSSDDDKPKLLLTVLISEKGFFVAGTGAVLPDSETDAPPEGTEGAPTVPKNSKGEYDYAGLTARMVEIKKAFPEETKLILGADPKVPYDILIKTMDAVREYKGQNLFYDVSLTII